MNPFEFKKADGNQGEYFIEDFEDKPYFHLLLQLPAELQRLHLSKIVSMDDESASQHLEKIIQHRREAMTKSEISDSILRSLVEENQKAFFENIETAVYESEDIGLGGTAHIKDFEYSQYGVKVPMAIKFVTTPRPTTVTAAVEHSILSEVERIETIEQIEKDAHLQYVCVPHPYFHHKTDRLQCYGMERVDGVSLKRVQDGLVDSMTIENLRTSFASIPQEDVLNEIDHFFSRMHTYCLHNDMMPGNIMVSRTGKIYIIDFGESTLISDIHMREEQLDQIMTDEVSKAKLQIRDFYKALSQSGR